MSKCKTILIDLDGVLAKTERPWQGPAVIEEPRPDALNLLQALAAEGYRIVLWSLRDKAIACQWLCDHNMIEYIDEIRDDKTPFDFVIDDRAIDGRQELWAILHDVIQRNH